jgi:hypothetical protein
MRHRYSEQDDAANYGSGGDKTDDVHAIILLMPAGPSQARKIPSE